MKLQNHRRRFTFLFGLITLALFAFLLYLTQRGVREAQLLRAIHLNDNTAVENLLREGANPNALEKNGQDSPILRVLSELFPFFLRRRKQVEKGVLRTALQIATENKNASIVHALLTHGANPHIKINSNNDKNITLLMHTARLCDNEQIVNDLLNHGIDVNAHDDTGKTALDYAAYCSHPRIVKCLLDRGADMNGKTNAGETVLMMAAYGDDYDAVKYLVTRGADVNAKSQDGSTALMEASLSNDTALVAYLIAKGADVNAKSQDGDTAWEIAYFHANIDVAGILEKHGAKVTRINFGEGFQN